MIKRITALLCTFACAFLMLAPVFSRKTSADVVASALELDVINEGIYSIPLPTYNSIYEYDQGHNPLPLVALISQNGFILQRSYDGITVADVDVDSAVYVASTVTSGEFSNVKYPMYLQGFGEGVVLGKIALYEGSFQLKTLTAEQFRQWRPAKLTSYYIFPEVQGDVITRDHLYIDFYVDYFNSSTGEYKRGAGFSLRIPFKPDVMYFESDYFHLPDDDVYPVGNYLAYQNESLLGYTYTAYNGIYSLGSAYGYNLGYDLGYNNGLSVGNEQGYNNGYNVGYNEALEVSGKYNFTSLISSVIDVPINALRSVLNFNILGVDMATFFFSLFTLAVVLTIVRMIL